MVSNYKLEQNFTNDLQLHWHFIKAMMLINSTKQMRIYIKSCIPGTGDWVHIKENIEHKYTFCENNVHFSTVKNNKVH